MARVAEVRHRGALPDSGSSAPLLDGKVDRRKVRTIHISAPFPDDVWVASPLLDAKIRQKILDALKPGEDLVALQHAFDALDDVKVSDKE